MYYAIVFFAGVVLTSVAFYFRNSIKRKWMAEQLALKGWAKSEIDRILK